MLSVGLDLHQRECQLAFHTDDGTIIDRRIPTTRPRLTQEFGGQPPRRILLEASTESEWVAQLLESLGHTVLVADPNFAPMYARRSRRIKTDKRDARALLEACVHETYRLVHRVSPATQALRAEVGVRQTLVRTRTRYIAAAKSYVRRDGLRVPPSSSPLVATRIAALDLSPALRTQLAPLLQSLADVTTQITALDATLARRAQADPVLRRLMTVPRIGVITATAFVAALDDVARFPTAHALEAYLGLVPTEYSSGDRRQPGHITKTGDSLVRALLVEAAWPLLRSRDPDLAPLHTWGRAIAARRGAKVAVVALARRLAGILYAVWRDGTSYDPAKLRRG